MKSIQNHRLSVRQTEQCLAELSESCGPQLVISAAVREQHGKDVSFHACMPPDAVLFARSTDDVARAVRICASHGMPIIAFGTGTSCEGHIAAVQGGLCIDLSQMDSVVRLSVDDLSATVGAGLTRRSLNQALHGSGLFFPIDPGADASLGGMVATRASGTNAVRYGTMRENVLALEAVLADGRVIRTGTLARKSSAGYDLTRLLVGSEGTLGIVTEVTVRLHPIPEFVVAATCSFTRLGDAVDCVIHTIQAGVPIGRVELLDDTQIRAVNRYSNLDLPVRPTLFLEFCGDRASVQNQVEVVGDLARDHGGADFTWADKPEARTRLWKARHDIWWANLALRPGSQGLPTDVCVPISRLTEQILAARRDIDEAQLIAPICGHVGDGNFHLCFVVNPDDPDEMARVEHVNSRMITRAIAAGGTCTGEHGIGLGKRTCLEVEAGAAADTMRLVKRALDPKNILNPGKVLLDGDR